MLLGASARSPRHSNLPVPSPKFLVWTLTVLLGASNVAWAQFDPFTPDVPKPGRRPRPRFDGQRPSGWGRGFQVRPSQTTFDVTIRMVFNAKVNSHAAQASMPVPMDWEGEQKVEISKREFSRCKASFREINNTVRVMLTRTDKLPAGSSAVASMTYKVTTQANHRKVTADLFDAQALGKIDTRLKKLYLRNTPGLPCNDKAIVELEKELSKGAKSDWERLERYHQWVHRNIRYQYHAEFMGADKALEKRVGDCEELSSLFVCLARAGGFPARMVVGAAVHETGFAHAWGEARIVDKNGDEHWVIGDPTMPLFNVQQKPYVILQKGDRFRDPILGKYVYQISPSFKSFNPAPSFETVQQVRLADTQPSDEETPTKDDPFAADKSTIFDPAK